MAAKYDVIIVGARCAGSPTAMLLAKRGYKVLLLDRAGFPSDTLSTHYIHQPGVAALQEWGLLDALVASGCPPIARQRLDLGLLVLEGAPPPVNGVAHAFAPRRTVLDHLLVQAAAAAGAEVREHFTVEGLTTEGGRVTGIQGQTTDGAAVTEAAQLVIGADGMRSLVARAVAAETYNAHPAMTCAFYTYWECVPAEAAELYARPGHMLIAAPTHHGLTLTIAYWPVAEFPRVSAGTEAHFLEALQLAPDLAGRVNAGRRVEPFRGTLDLPNYFRRSHGPGWALVGDAGYHKDPILAQGISDAFRDAKLLAGAVDAGLSSTRPLDDALADYESRRNAASAEGYANTLNFARLEPPPAELQALMGALQGNQPQTDRFFGTIAGSVSSREFFTPENIGRIMAGAAGANAG